MPLARFWKNKWIVELEWDVKNGILISLFLPFQSAFSLFTICYFHQCQQSALKRTNEPRYSTFNSALLNSYICIWFFFFNYSMLYFEHNMTKCHHLAFAWMQLVWLWIIGFPTCKIISSTRSQRLKWPGLTHTVHYLKYEAKYHKHTPTH